MAMHTSHDVTVHGGHHRGVSGGAATAIGVGAFALGIIVDRLWKNGHRGFEHSYEGVRGVLAGMPYAQRIAIGNECYQGSELENYKQFCEMRNSNLAVAEAIKEEGALNRNNADRLAAKEYQEKLEGKLDNKDQKIDSLKDTIVELKNEIMLLKVELKSSDKECASSNKEVDRLKNIEIGLIGKIEDWKDRFFELQKMNRPFVHEPRYVEKGRVISECDPCGGHHRP